MDKKKSQREYRGNLVSINGHRITYVISTDDTENKVLISDDDTGQQICIVYGKEKQLSIQDRKRMECGLNGKSLQVQYQSIN